MSETITQTRTEAVRRVITLDSNRHDTFLRSTSLQKILCSPHVPILPAIIVWMRSSQKYFNQNAESWRVAVHYFLVQCALQLAQGAPSIDPGFYKKFISITTPYLKYLLFVSVIYLSLTFIFVEIIGCLYALMAFSSPPGLSFMIASLSCIGIVIIRVFLINHGDFCSLETCVKCNNVNEIDLTNALSKLPKLVSPKDLQTRLSRPRTRRIVHLYFGDKTLSKIKLF